MKILRQTTHGENIIECPVCKVGYIESGITNHISQRAGKEAQYHMANILYKEINRLESFGETKEQALTDVQSYSIIMEACPHWKYLLDSPTLRVKRPVEQK